MKDTLNDAEYVVNENHLNNVIAEVCWQYSLPLSCPSEHDWKSKKH